MPEGAGASPTSVVVGVDDSADSRSALEWAAGEARLRRAPLRIVHALPFSILRHGGPDPSLERAKRVLQGLAAQAHLLDERPLTVTTEVIDGVPSKVLVDESRQCALLVMGSRGHGGITRLVLGSTAIDVTARAACPVAVIPAGAVATDRQGDVVVGVDDSAATERALGFAFARAAQRQAGVAAVHVRGGSPPPGEHGAAAAGTAPDLGDSQAHALLASAIRPWLRRYPAVPVTQEVLRGPIAATLAQALTTHGDIAVVGARGRSVLAGTVLGSISQDLLHKAAGPVVIVR